MGNQIIIGGSTGYLLWENNKTKKGYKLFYNFLKKFNKKITFQQIINIIDNSSLTNIDKLKSLKELFFDKKSNILESNNNSISPNDYITPNDYIPPNDFPVRGKVKSQWYISNLPKNWKKIRISQIIIWKLFLIKTKKISNTHIY